MLQILPMLHRVGQSVDHMTGKALSELGLTPRQALILIKINEHQPTNNTQIISETGIDRSTVTDVVRRLEAKNLLARTPSKKDMRVIEINLTQSGIGVCREAEECFADCEAHILDVIGNSKYRVVRAAMETLAADIGPIPSAVVAANRKLLNNATAPEGP